MGLLRLQQQRRAGGVFGIAGVVTMHEQDVAQFAATAHEHDFRPLVAEHRTEPAVDAYAAQHSAERRREIARAFQHQHGNDVGLLRAFRQRPPHGLMHGNTDGVLEACPKKHRVRHHGIAHHHPDRSSRCDSVRLPRQITSGQSWHSTWSSGCGQPRVFLVPGSSIPRPVEAFAEQPQAEGRLCHLLDDFTHDSDIGMLQCQRCEACSCLCIHDEGFFKRSLSVPSPERPICRLRWRSVEV